MMSSWSVSRRGDGKFRKEIRENEKRLSGGAEQLKVFLNGLQGWGGFIREQSSWEAPHKILLKAVCCKRIQFEKRVCGTGGAKKEKETQ